MAEAAVVTNGNDRDEPEHEEEEEEEETWPVVVHLFEAKVQAGFAGYDEPQVVFPLVASLTEDGFAVGDAAADAADLIWPIERGIVNHWDALEAVFAKIFSELMINPEKHKIILGEFAPGSKEQRERLMTMLFYSFGVQGIAFLPVSSLLSSGRAIGVFVDVSWDVTQIIPMSESVPIPGATIRAELGMRDVVQAFLNNLEAQDGMQTCRNLYEAMILFEKLADRHVLLGDPLSCNVLLKDLRGIGENTVLNESFTLSSDDLQQAAATLLTGTSAVPGILDLILEAISKLPLDVRELLTSSIVLSGSGTLVSGFAQELQKRLSKAAPSTLRVKTLANPDRLYAWWVSGSILGSLSGFANECVSKNDFVHDPAMAASGTSVQWHSFLLSRQYVGHRAVERRFMLRLSHPIATMNDRFAEINEVPMVEETDVRPDVDELLEYLFLVELQGTSIKGPLVLSTANTHPAAISMLMQTAFAQGFDKVTMVDAASAALVALGRSTGLIVDVGHQSTRITPIVDSTVLEAARKIVPWGGRNASATLQKLLRTLDHGERGRDAANEITLVDNIKEEVGYVRAESNEEADVEVMYGLPDNRGIVLREERWRIFEALFQSSEASGFNLAEAICGSIEMVNDLDQRRELYASIILVGGTSMCEGFSSRLETHLRACVNQQVNVIVPPERRHLVWLGASILADSSSSSQRFHALSYSCDKTIFDASGPGDCGMKHQEVVIKSSPAAAVDLGSHIIKVGQAGEKTPRREVASVVGRERSPYSAGFEDLVRWATVYRQVSGSEAKQYRALYNLALDGELCPLNRSRLFLVGQSQAGKSALSRSLLGESFGELPQTLGVDIATVTATISEKATTWEEKDFAHSEFAIHSARTVAAAAAGTRSKPSEGSASAGQMRNPESARDLQVCSSFLPLEAMETLRRPESMAGVPSSRRRGVADLVRSLARNVSSRLLSTFRGVFLLDQDRIPVADPEPISLSATEEIMSKLDDQLVKKFVHAKETLGRDLTLTISSWELCGQNTFSPLQHILLSRSAVYLVVFDMRHVLRIKDRPQALENLLYWLQCIDVSTSGARVLLVGTYGDQVHTSNELALIDSVLRTELSLSAYASTLFQEYDPKGLCFCPVDNTLEDEDAGVRWLRALVTRISLLKPHVAHPVPLAWSRFFDLLIETGEEYLALEDAEAIAAEGCNISDTEQVQVALALFHELGMLFYFREVAGLRDFVVLNPQWLIRCCSMVIRDVRMHPYCLPVRKRLQHACPEDLVLLRVQGIATRKLLYSLWVDQDQNSNDQDFTRRRFLIAMLRHTMLACSFESVNMKTLHPSQTSSSDCQRAFVPAGGVLPQPDTFLIPSLLCPQRPGDKDVAQRLQQIEELMPSTASGQALVFYLTVEGTFPWPKGLFERLVCLAVEHSHAAAFLGASRAPLSGPGEVLFWLGEASCRMTEEVEEGRIRCIVDESRAQLAFVDELLSMLARLNEEVMHNQATFAAQLQVIVDRLGTVQVDYDEAKYTWSKNRKYARGSCHQKVPRASLARWMSAQDLGDVFDAWRDELPGCFGLSRAQHQSDVVGHIRTAGSVPLPSKADSHVFISYRQANAGETCTYIRDILEGLGLEVCLRSDTENVPSIGGVVKNVRNSIVLLLLLSDGVLLESSVQEEVRTAMDLRIPVIVAHDGDSGYESFLEIYNAKRQSPEDLRVLFDEIESLPLRRRLFERRAMESELFRRVLVEVKRRVSSDGTF